jgi:hypothetical protein
MLELILSISSSLGVFGTILLFGYGIIQVSAIKRYKTIIESNRVIAQNLTEEIQKLRKEKGVLKYMESNPGKSIDSLVEFFTIKIDSSDEKSIILVAETETYKDEPCRKLSEVFWTQALKFSNNTKFIIKAPGGKTVYSGIGPEGISLWGEQYGKRIWADNSGGTWKLYRKDPYK